MVIYITRKIFLLCFLICCLAFKTKAQAIYVDSSVAVSGDGSSWANAYKELRDALMAIRSNTAITEIHIAKGTYKPTDDENVDSAFCIYRGGIKIIGGYAIGGVYRDFNANKVILSGITASNNVHTRHIFIAAGITGADSVILDGLFISGGNGTNGYVQTNYNNQLILGTRGAGVCLQNNADTKFIIRNCSFIKNTGALGAGVYSSLNGMLKVENCNFDSNLGYGALGAETNSWGAGIYNYQTTSSITNCSFTNNTFNRSGWGIGIYNEKALITISNTSFIDNSGSSDGGAIANVGGSDAVISYCTFTDNTSARSISQGLGAGIYNSKSNLNLQHSTFVGNVSGVGTVYLFLTPTAVINSVSFIKNKSYTDEYSGGGGISNVSSSPLISNCLFVMDTASIGAAIYNSAGSSPLVTNCTFYKNFASHAYPSGGAVCCADSSGGTYDNCIFWDNAAYFLDNDDFVWRIIDNEFYSANKGNKLSKPRPAISYSILKTPFPISNVIDSGNNSNEYPQFVDTSNIAGDDGQYGTSDDGLRLQTCSPGIDAGINSAIPEGVTKDIKDDDRILNHSIDLGCYENVSPVVNGTTTIADSGDSIIKSVYGRLNVMKDCQLMAGIEPSGTTPVTGGIQAKVMIDTTGNLFTTPYVHRYYDINPSENPESSTATISLYFTQEDFDAYNLTRGDYPSLPTDDEDAANNKSNIVIHQFHGVNGQGAETIIIPSGVEWNGANNWWEVTFEVTGFSRFFLNTSLTALPIVLEYFKGRKQNASIYLTWKLDCSNSSQLTLNLQRSSDGNTFTTLYQNTISEQQCQLPLNYTDVDPFAGKNYYRLKLIEPTGKTVYSNTLLFSNPAGASIIVRPLIIIKGQLLNVTVPQKNYAITIYNSIGRLVKKQELVQDVNSISLPIGSGIYFYQVTDNNQQIQKTGKIIIN
jgi:hypothetical protein